MDPKNNYAWKTHALNRTESHNSSKNVMPDEGWVVYIWLLPNIAGVLCTSHENKNSWVWKWCCSFLKYLSSRNTEKEKVLTEKV